MHIKSEMKLYKGGGGGVSVYPNGNVTSLLPECVVDIICASMSMRRQDV